MNKNHQYNCFFKYKINIISKILVVMLLVFCQIANWQVLASDGQLLASQKTVSKQIIKALYIPLADHYAAIIAYESYRDKMIYADFQIKQMESWHLLRAYYQSGEADMAFVMSPLAMDMYHEAPNFSWVGLMHRDGGALAINDLLNESVSLAKLRQNRKPDNKVAKAIENYYRQTNRSVEIAVPDILSIHTVVLYQYLKSHGLRLSLSTNYFGEVLALPIAPSKSPAFIKAKSSRAQASGFVQSLPWADIVETGGMGQVAWYSKDVLPWLHGHVDCIAIAAKSSLDNKFQAVHEVMQSIHQAGKDIENARTEGGEALLKIIQMIRKHIPEHSTEAIIASLNPEIRVINYDYLNVDKAGLKQIMDLAIEAKILKHPINIDEFVDQRFVIIND